MNRGQRRDSWLALMGHLSGQPLVTVLRRDLLLLAELCPNLRGSQPTSLAVHLTRHCQDFWSEGLIDVGLAWNGGGWARQAVVEAWLDPIEDRHVESQLRGHRPERRRELEPNMREHHRLVTVARSTGGMADALAVVRHSSRNGEQGGRARVHCYRLEPRAWSEAREACRRLELAGIDIAPAWELPTGRTPRRFGASLKTAMRADERAQRLQDRIRSLKEKHAARRGSHQGDP